MSETPTPTPRETPADDAAGPFLDRMIELHVFGRKPVAEVPRYSTEDRDAELVIARLNRPPLRWMELQEADGWLFAWREPGTAGDAEATATRYVRLVSARGETRALAVCRAALKLVAVQRSTKTG